MSLNQIGRFQFEFWRGDMPTLAQEHTEKFTRAGTNGVAHRLLGTRGESFTAELESWHPSYAIARASYVLMQTLVGTTQQVIHESAVLSALYGVHYFIENIEQAECVACVRLLAPGKNYPAGARLVTRWTLCPIAIVDLAVPAG